MNHQEMVNLARDHARQKPFLQLASHFSPQRVVGHEKIRIGSDIDGGYVMLDDFADIDLALSFGVDVNADWDVDVARRGVPVQQYDHSVPAPPIDDPKIRFFKQMIVPAGSAEDRTCISDILKSVKIERAASVILKIDIESAEWPVFERCSDADLDKFSQILVEFHDFNQAVDPYWLKRATAVMQKLRQRFNVFHVHANNWTPMAVIGNVHFPGTLEVSLAHSERYKFEATDELFPTRLDHPNNPLRPDVYLGAFRFAPI